MRARRSADRRCGMGTPIHERQDVAELTDAELLAMPDAATIEVAKDVTYGNPMTYRAVPVAARTTRGGDSTATGEV